MSAAKKLDVDPAPEAKPEPEWKKARTERQKMLRALRTKSFSTVLNTLIRKNMKEPGSTESDPEAQE
jgi:hypothetical protein